MKIIFVISAMNGGGAERVIATLANRYVSSGDEVTVLMVAGNECAYSLDERIKVLSIGKPSKGNPLIQIKRLMDMRRFFAEHTDSCMIAFGTQINMFSVLAWMGLKSRLILSERNDPHQCGYQKLRNVIYRIGSRAGCSFVFQTGEAQNCFPAAVRKRSRVIPNPLRTDLPQKFEGNRKKRIAAVGRLEPQKNYTLLLQAFREFHQHFPEYELHIFGKGKLQAMLQEFAQRMGISEQVIWEGFRADVLYEIRDYEMYVLSSDYEGIPNSLMEAMALGLPCISTDCPIGGAAMCIESGKNGLLVPVGDVHRLQDAMEWIARNPHKAQQLGKAACTIRERFGEGRIADMWHEAMEG